MVQLREECQQLDGDERLAKGGKDSKPGIEEGARLLSQVRRRSGGGLCWGLRSRCKSQQGAAFAVRPPPAAVRHGRPVQSQQCRNVPARRLQRITSLGTTLRTDSETCEALQELARRLLRNTETALYTFKRSYLWREGLKVGQGCWGGCSTPLQCVVLPWSSSPASAQAQHGILSCK